MVRIGDTIFCNLTGCEYLGQGRNSCNICNIDNIDN